MTEIQKLLLDLLVEVDRICVQNNIQYFLCGSTAFAAAFNGGFSEEEEILHADVLMRAPELLKFIEAVENNGPEHRAIESWLDNPDYPEFGARYVAEDTLFLDLPYSHTYSHYGFGVRITVLRDFPSGKMTSKLATMRETGWEQTFEPAPEELPSKTDQMYRKAVEFEIKKAGGREFYSRKLFRELCKAYTNPGCSKVFIKHFRDERKHFDTAVFREPELCRLGDYSFPMPKADRFLTKMYGVTWRSRKRVPGRRMTEWIITDTAIPYKDYLEEIEKAGCSLEEYVRVRDRALYYPEEAQGSLRAVDHYWELMVRTGDRFDLYDLYEPQKERIMKLYREGLYDELAALLEPYARRIEQNRKAGLGLCFDKDILDCMLEVFRQEGRNAYADEVRALVPPEHLQPMVIRKYNE